MNSYSTEYYLKKGLDKDFRKADRDDYKETVRRSSHSGHSGHSRHSGHPGYSPHVHFVVPSETIRVRPGYTTVYPEMPTVTYIPVPVPVPVPTPRYGYGYGYEHGYPASNPVVVPTDLAARGIRAVEEKPKARSSGSVSWGAPECDINHRSRRCNVCGKDNVNHKDYDCNLFKERRY